ncbi:MAG: PH domain-containing protein [Propionicimonas sp.]|nr:PH domain-containing protein [Propionicimonas sp.]
MSQPGAVPPPDPEQPPGTRAWPADGPDAAETPSPSAKLTERPHPLTPLIRGWVVLLAIVIGVGREFIPDGTDRPGELPPLQFLLLGIGAIALIAAVAGFVTWRFTRFVVDAEELRIDTGAIFRTSQRIAFERIQAIDVVQPFAARLFQLAEVQIDVGGGDSTKLRYLSLRRAYELRDYLLARARGQRVNPARGVELSADSILQDLHAEDEVLVRVPPQTLVLAALTSHEFFGIMLSGVAAAVLFFGFGLGVVGIGLAVPTVTALVGFVGRRVTSQFNYTLSRREAGLRITRGLTSLTSQSLPARRVQAVQLSQSLLWRRLGLYRIDLEVLGWGAVTNEENSSQVNSIMLPAGNIDQVRVALRALWPSADFETVDLTPAPVQARWLHPFSAPFLRWGFDDRLFVSRHGWLVRRWQLVPHARAQSLHLAQGPVSRRLGIADLGVHTAGAHLSVHAEGMDAATVQARLPALTVLLGLRDVDVTDPGSDSRDPNPNDDPCPEASV